MSMKSSMLMRRYGYFVFAKVRERIAKDCGMICAYCEREVVIGSYGGFRLATIDHKIPLSRGGTWKRYNLTCACKRCNEIKGSMTDKEFMSLPLYLREAI